MGHQIPYTRKVGPNLIQPNALSFKANFTKFWFFNKDPKKGCRGGSLRDPRGSPDLVRIFPNIHIFYTIVFEKSESLFTSLPRNYHSTFPLILMSMGIGKGSGNRNKERRGARIYPLRSTTDELKLNHHRPKKIFTGQMRLAYIASALGRANVVFRA